MPKEFRKFGPPGTGKTSSLATRDIPQAVAAYGSEKIIVASYTKAAAVEIANKRSRDTGERIHVNPDNVGTLHALCFRALGRPEIAEAHKKEWNDIYGNMYPITGSLKGAMDEGGVNNQSSAQGDEMLSGLNILRARMKPRIRTSTKDFEKKWTEFKNDNGYMDFTDLIEVALDKTIYAPGQPKVMFVDEAQDFTPLQLKLVRSWSQHMEWLVLLGDDDQTIFSFTGSSPDAFLNPPIDAKFKTVLSQSYRVPQVILERSQKLIKKVMVREPKIYKPRIDQTTGLPAVGKIRNHYENFKNFQRIIDEIKDYVANEKTVMLLASCSYMLDRLKNELKINGIPFHNPYRKTRSDWNPLVRSSQKTMPVDTLLAFLSDNKQSDKSWTVRQFVNWAKELKVGENGLVKKVGKNGIKFLKQAIEDDEEGLDSVKDAIGDMLT
ncbi:MAG TPA: ATP-dependent helicase, partial [Desulfobacterales bacterium]|nr:ATP-dependent helicase [Desulfobacterales bacterium]